MAGWIQSGDFRSFPLARGLALHVHATPRFKTISTEAFLGRDLGPGATSFALLPGLLRRGTRRFPSMQALARRLEDLYGASLKGSLLKVGEAHLMSFRISHPAPAFVPEGEAVLEDALGLLADVLADPALEDGRFPEAVFAGEAANHRRLLRGLVNQREDYAEDRLLKAMCGEERYSVHELGSEEELDGLTPGGLTAFWASGLRSWPLDLFVVGDVDPDRAVDLVVRRFGGERDALAGLAPTERRAPPAQPRRIEEPFPGAQTRIVQGYRILGDAGGRRRPAFLALDELLGGDGWSRLFQTVREAEGMAYDVGSDLEWPKGLLLVSAGVAPGMEDRVLDRVAGEIERLREGRIELRDLAGACGRLAADFRSGADSPSALVSEAIEGLLSGEDDSLEARASAVERVTAEDVAEAARSLRLDTTFLLVPRGEDSRSGAGPRPAARIRPRPRGDDPHDA